MTQTRPLPERNKSTAELRNAWHLHFGSAPPPDLGRENLARAIWWKAQEQTQGGYSADVLRELNRLARQLGQSGELNLEKRWSIKPGTRLVREWKNQTIEVTAIENGFIYNRRKYASLSHVARAITGTRWSGPRFFGLRQHIRKGSVDA